MQTNVGTVGMNGLMEKKINLNAKKISLCKKISGKKLHRMSDRLSA